MPPDLGFSGEQFTIGELPLEANLDALGSAGADGLEYPLPGPGDAARFRDALRNAGLRYRGSHPRPRSSPSEGAVRARVSQRLS